MKNKKVLIISSIIAIIIIIAIAIGVLYFATDLFKTDKQLFYKYIAKVKVMDTEFVNQYIVANEKITKNSNSSLANINLSTSTLNAETGIADIQEILKITSNGLVNVPLKQSYRDLTLSNNNQNLLTLKYMRDDNIYALKADNIVTKYIAVENSNLKELFAKLGVEDTAEIPNSIPTNYEEILKIDEQTLASLNQTYLTLIYNNVDNTHFYKIINEDKTIKLGVSLSEQETYNLIKVILETAKNDNTLLNLIINKAQLLGYTNITVQDIQSKIQTYIDNTNGDTFSTDKDFIKLSIIKQDKNVIAIELETNYEKEVSTTTGEIVDNVEPTAEKNRYNVKLDFSKSNKLVISMKENNIGKVNIAIDYSYDTDNINLNTELSVVENEANSTIKIQYQISNYQTKNILQNSVIDFKDNKEETTYQVNLSNEIKLKQDIQIEKLTTENSAKINDMTSEEISQLLTAIVARVMTLYGTEINSLTM